MVVVLVTVLMVVMVVMAMITVVMVMIMRVVVMVAHTLFLLMSPARFFRRRGLAPPGACPLSAGCRGYLG
ncbi:hypothetical protein GMPD_04470 [Geomonas paludis]|uniref:ABC transmembrane type-1 domain-containing protein n=1 Tax=Geomonas paludis TaxID=2740185 RepID=A0A6V8MR09_9BACT|nr:hypothetical protein GMPD_04470 [Geomonas paludis]